MDQKTVVEYLVIYKPNPIVGIMEDVFTFGGFAFILWFNHRFLSGNAWIDFVFIALWIAQAAGMQSRRRHQFKSVEEAIKHLEGKN